MSEQAKKNMEELVTSRCPVVSTDNSISQAMRDAFARLQAVPYLAKDFEGDTSSESTSDEASERH